jgi:serine/threonine-protein kinase
VVTVATGERKVIVNDAMAPHYVPTGHIVFARAGSLFAIPFNLASLAITGEAVPVIQGVRGVGSTGADYDVSLSGSLVYKPVAGGKNRLVWVERSGTATPVIESEPGSPFLPHPRLSPDGRRVAVPVGGARGSLDLWLLEIARGTLRRVTFEGINTRPLWSPDGNELIFASSQGGGGYSVFTTQADGSGTAVRHTNGPHRIPTSVNSDGQVLVFRQAGEGWDIGMVRLDKASEPQMLLASPFNEHSGVLSPDDRWMAYVSDESGRDEVYVTSFPDMGRKDQVSTEGGTEPLWSRDSKELYYRNGDQMMAVSVQMKPDLVFGRPAVLLAGPYEMSTDNISANYDVAVDGRFLMMEDASGGASATVNVVLNWFEELRRLSPK